jgi:hypothetical protein
MTAFITVNIEYFRHLCSLSTSTASRLGVDDLVNLGHEADDFVKCHNDAVVVDKIFESELILAINEDYLLCC